jgi:hypothetical protein
MIDNDRKAAPGANRHTFAGGLDFDSRVVRINPGARFENSLLGIDSIHRGKAVKESDLKR